MAEKYTISSREIQTKPGDVYSRISRNRGDVKHSVFRTLEWIDDGVDSVAENFADAVVAGVKAFGKRLRQWKNPQKKKGDDFPSHSTL